MLSQKHNYSSNPLLLEAAVKAIERRKTEEALDPVLLARRIGVPPDPWQAAMLRSAARQLIMLCSRQSGKSLVASLLALWTAIYKPGALVLILAPALRQSQLTHRTIRQLHATLPDAPKLYGESALRIELSNGSQIVALPGTEKTVRGYSSVDLLICDEAARCDDSLFASVSPMLAVSQGRIVLLSTPFGRRGYFFDVWENGGPAWQRTRVTAFECPRISREWLEQERQQIGDFWFEQEYLCEFKDDVSSVFRYEDIQAAMVDSIEPQWSIADALR